jgi:hypothetical protein
VARILYEAGWAPEPVWTLWRRQKSLAPTGNRTPAVQPVVRSNIDWATPHRDDAILCHVIMYPYKCLYRTAVIDKLQKTQQFHSTFRNKCQTSRTQLCSVDCTRTNKQYALLAQCVSSYSGHSTGLPRLLLFQTSHSVVQTEILISDREKYWCSPYCVLRNLVVAMNCFVWSLELRSTELYRSSSSSRLLSSSCQKSYTIYCHMRVYSGS